MKKTKNGIVYLVGSGPGDPGLLTLKAKACLEKADIVVYDYLANEVFLDFAPEDAERIYVGKKGGCHTMSQEEINRLIVDKARHGHVVVRLKGGDPFIFGRGGEEAQELIAEGVPFEVVPGVTSAIAVPAYAGIPLTHRDYTSTVAFITGHEDPSKESSGIAWEKLATGVGTLVFLMGVGNIKNISKNLMAHGRGPDTPVGVIHRGTVPEQKTVTGTLRNIAERVREEGLKPPAIIVVGDVVNLRKTLNWFETRPLYGKRILVTRARNQASAFLARLTTLGAVCIEFPTIEIVPPESWAALDAALGALETYDWVVFTSVNGVKSFFKRLDFLGRDVRDLKGIKIGAIGPQTALAVQQKGIRPDMIPEEFRAEAVVEAFRRHGAKALRILLPRAAQAREILPEELEKMGAEVNVVDAYRTVKPKADKAEVRRMLQQGSIHMVTFTSSSTVRHFAEMFDPEGDQLFQWMEETAVACIGPITAKTAEETGFRVDLVSSQYTIEGLTEAIIRFYDRK
ncbi:MAG: uroporphyrinogen-III C-methyltransferase [Desulfatiglandales bacterium]